MSSAGLVETIPRRRKKAPPLTEAQKKLAGDNYRLAYTAAKTFVTQMSDQRFDDYVSVAFEALVSASRTYRPERGFTFATYAYDAMVKRIREYRGGRNRSRWRKLKDKSEYVPFPTMNQMSERRAGRLTARTDPDARGEDIEAIEYALAGLTPRQRTVVHLRAYAGFKNHQIGAMLNVGPNRAGQIYNEALARCRADLEAAGVMAA